MSCDLRLVTLFFRWSINYCLFIQYNPCLFTERTNTDLRPKRKGACKLFSCVKGNWGYSNDGFGQNKCTD